MTINLLYIGYLAGNICMHHSFYVYSIFILYVHIIHINTYIHTYKIRFEIMKSNALLLG